MGRAQDKHRTSQNNTQPHALIRLTLTTARESYKNHADRTAEQDEREGQQRERERERDRC